MVSLLVTIHTYFDCLSLSFEELLSNRLLGLMGPSSFKRTSDFGISRINHKFLRERFSNRSTPSVCNTSFRPETSVCRLRRISKHGGSLVILSFLVGSY